MTLIERLSELSPERTHKTIKELWAILNIMERTKTELTESEVTFNALLQMNLRIDELEEALIYAKSRALPDDFFDKNRRITYTIEELDNAKSK